MKRTKKTIAYILLATATLGTACTKDFIEVNKEPIGRPVVAPDQLLITPLVNVLSANLTRNRNFNNELMQVTVDRSDAEGRVFRYDIRRNIADQTWNAWYVNLTDFKDIYNIAKTPEYLNTSYQGIALVAQAWVYSLLTDTYGDVPYLEANAGKEGKYQPVFDKQKDIYLDLFEKLEEANSLLKENTAINAATDPVYQGNVENWRRLGNSLYLRLLMRVSGKSEVSGQVIAKIKEIAETRRAEYPIIETNEQTARILWNGTNSTTAAYSSPLMASVRPADFRGPGIASFFIDNLTMWSDPRIDNSLGFSNINAFGIKPGPNGFEGIPSGYAQGEVVALESRFYSQGETGVDYTLQTEPKTGIIMNAAEVYFILAEAAVKNWITGDAGNFYYKGVTHAINYWIRTPLTEAQVIGRLTTAGIQWNNSLVDSDLTDINARSKMALIHNQKYYALFLVDFQQWFEYRRTGYPMLQTGPGMVNNRVMPARLNYPLVTQSTNPTNYNKALETQGPDLISTQVWWQKP